MKFILLSRSTLLLLGTSCCCVAFSIRSCSSRRRKAKLPGYIRKPKTQLALSDIPENEPDEQKKDSKISAQQQQQQKRLLELPPLPQNQVVLWGDMLSIFVYGYTDHFVGQDLAKYTVSQMMMEITQQGMTSAAAIDAAYSAATTTATTPVWLDISGSSSSTATVLTAVSSTSQMTVLHSRLADSIIMQYSPLLEQAGVATCLLAAVWLLAGWILQSFSFKNTTDCSTEHALLRTVQTWIMSSVILLTLSGIVCSLPSSALLSPSTAAAAAQEQEFLLSSFLTWPKGDVAFIIDSLSVLLLWRFMVNWVLGTGGGDNE